MYKISYFNRDKNGNRGKLITESHYETEEEARKAIKSAIFLCTHPSLAKSGGWKLKNCVVTGPKEDTKFDLLRLKVLNIIIN